MKDFSRTKYDYIDNGIWPAFVERWHAKTLSFHLSIRDMTITLDNISRVLHFLITIIIG